MRRRVDRSRGGNHPTAGHLLWLIRTGRASTRADLRRHTGLSRSTVGHRLAALRSAGYLRVRGALDSTGGRRAEVLEFNHEHGVVLIADLGATRARLALLDLAGAVLAEWAAPVRIADGPGPVLDWVAEQFRRLLTEAGRDPGTVSGIGLGVPGPVEFATGVVRQPPIMPGWDDYPVVDHLRRHWPVPVVVDNDANLMALGEQAVHYPESRAVMLVKASTGIGAGLVLCGEIFRGVDGGAGDIGHVRLTGEPDAVCMCGARGCLASVASGAALATRLTALGTPTASSQQLRAHITAGHPQAVHLARQAGQRVGEVLATVVTLINPQVLILAGDLADTHFLTGLREVLYQRALPRATRNLTITTSRLGERAGLTGAHRLVVETVCSPEAIDERLATPVD